MLVFSMFDWYYQPGLDAMGDLPAMFVKCCHPGCAAIAVLALSCLPGRAGETEAEKTLMNVEGARSQAKLLHETYEAILQAMHRRYFKDDARLPIPSRVLDEVFSDVERASNISARWIAVNAQAMSLDHEPKDPFETQAARHLASGKEEFELVEKGIYRRAGAITLFASCLKCHAPAPMRQDALRVAGLVISMPVKDSPKLGQLVN